MPCIKADQSGAIAVTMPPSPIMGTPAYHYYATKIPLKTWEALSPKLQDLYLNKILSAKTQDKVSSVHIVVIPQNNRFEVIALKIKLSAHERELSGEETYTETVIVDTFQQYSAKNFKKIQWSLKNICI